MRIGLNAGHTISGPGYGTSGVIVESQDTRKVVARLTEIFKSMGVTVVPCTIDKAASQSAYLKQAVALANQDTLDWFISIHFNNDSAKQGKGVEVYTYKGRQYQDALEVCEHISALGFNNRGVKDGSGLYVVHRTKAKSMLIEVCFVNDPDASNYKNKFNDVCNAIAYALADYVAPAAPKPQAPSVTPAKQKYVKVIYDGADGLTVRRSPSWDASAAAGTVKKNEVFTVVQGPIKVGSGSMYKLKSGLYITASSKYVSVFEK